MGSIVKQPGLLCPLVLSACIVCLVGFLDAHAVVFGQTPSSQSGHLVVIPRVEGSWRLHTDLDQPPWDRAAMVTGFIDIGGGHLATEPTRVYLCYDRSALCVAYRCEGRGREQLRAVVTERDDRVWTDDSVELFLAPDASSRVYYQLVVNSAGIIYDGLGSDQTWDAAFMVRTTADETGWTAVCRVPFQQLRTPAPKPGATWGVNFCRDSSLPAKSSWSPVPGSFSVPSCFGMIVFGDTDTVPARMREIEPIHVGANLLRIDSAPGLRCRLQGWDSGWDSVFVQTEPLGNVSEVGFALRDDRARRIAFSVVDEKNLVLSSSWCPVQSPMISSRIRRLLQNQQDITDGLSRFPDVARGKAEALLDRAGPVLRKAGEILDDHSQYTKENWQWLKGVLASLEHDVNDAGIYARTVSELNATGFGVGVESSMRKVMIRDFAFEGQTTDTVELSLARNEHEALQVVVIPFHQALKKVSLHVSPLREEGQRSGKPSVSSDVSLVGHVDVVDNPPYQVSYRDWWPDPLLDFQRQCDVALNEHVAYWVDVSTKPDTPSGIYEGRMTVRAMGCPPAAIRLKVRVWDFDLPDGTHLTNAFTYDQPSVRRVYGDRWTKELEYRYYDLVLEHRLGIDHLYRKTCPDLDVVEYGRSKGMNAFNLTFLGKGSDRATVAERLKACVPAVQKAGMIDSAYVYGFDEVTKESFARIREVFGEVRRRFPGLRTATTAYDDSFGQDTGLRGLVDVWVPLTDQYNRAEAEKLRQEGRDMWWYICVRPHHPYANWFIEYPAIEARLLTGAMSHKYGTGGFLYYQMCLWSSNREPIDAGPYTRWNPGTYTNDRGQTANGDGSLICPGPEGPLSTIRLANIRDGLEDYEYLYLLGGIVRTVRALAATPEREAFLEQADPLLVIPDSVVRSLIDYTHDPQKVYRFRQSLAEAILAGRRLVDANPGIPAGR